jgi:hypothetical protein
MTPQQLKPIGIACFVICAICLFVAFERYQANAANVRAFTGVMPRGGMSPFGDLRPAMPAATKYALFFALLSGVGGAYCVIKARQPNSSSDQPASQPPAKSNE